MRVTTLDEIRAQTEAQIVELPGFREGASIYVRLRMIDMEPRLLALQIGNPLLAEAQKMAQGGMSREEIAGRVGASVGIKEMIPLLDEIAKEALVEPTYAEIVAIQPLTLKQKLRIFEYITGAEELLPFRENEGLREGSISIVPLGDPTVELPAESE